MYRKNKYALRVLFFFLAFAACLHAMPLPEHPRPDFERAEWVNLNGAWDFEFDAGNAGISAGWERGTHAFTRKIEVPFPWGSRLSGVKDEADIAWYRRGVRIPENWKGKRVFVVIGASDWITQGWFAGKSLGEHRGGYTPFEFEVTDLVEWGKDQPITLRVDDTAHPFKLEGKQGYGEAKGLWQTVYLEARGAHHVSTVHFTPDIDRSEVRVQVTLDQPLPRDGSVQVSFKTGGVSATSLPLRSGQKEVEGVIKIPDLRLWSLEDPFLYEVDVSLGQGANADRLSTYFGMRKVSVEMLPGTQIPYVALNGRPIYLQLTLDQSYHPDGYYTFPTDEFMRDEILRSKKLGLNGNRVHIKVEVPRKLYWADRLGVLIMADVPNSWGDPSPESKAESEFAMRRMIARDFNHPSIFSWVVFNETWGLFTNFPDKTKKYLPETQEWVIEMYKLAKQLDPTRLVEDNSPCNFDHAETDLNTWHEYLPGYAWKDRMQQITKDTFPGSTWNYIGGRKQGAQPTFNSECGNVWGYEGSTGDVDFTWDYHIMLNEFRRHPKLAGWLYTEHHDVINEWNGYYRFDRTEKTTGLDELAPGMSLADLHSPYYLSTGSELCRDVKPGEEVDVPLHASLMTDRSPSKHLRVRGEFYGWDDLGNREVYSQVEQALPFSPWSSAELKPLRIRMPGKAALGILALRLESESGHVLQRNFTTFRVGEGTAPRYEKRASQHGAQHLLRFSPRVFSDAKWSVKQWDVLDGAKMNGAGYGFFEYTISWPKGVLPEAVTGASLVFEASSKPLLGKDREGANYKEADFMRGKGDHDPSSNPNSYPMTDVAMNPSEVWVSVNGISAGSMTLPDDPADHRGVLSWHAQLRDKKLREAGTYGYLLRAVVSPAALKAAAASGKLVVRFAVQEGVNGGLALYGEHFGRYPLDPTLVIETKH